MRGSSTPPKTRNKWLTRSTLVVLLVVFGLACADCAVFKKRETQVSAVVHELGAKHGTIGGWPIGVEHCIVFSRSLTNSELQQLATLSPIHQSGRHDVGVNFKNCSMSEERANKVRSILHGIPVHVWGSGQKVETH